MPFKKNVGNISGVVSEMLDPGLELITDLFNSTSKRTRIDGKFGNDIPVTVGVHQGSVLFFIIVLEALSREFRTAFLGILFLLPLLVHVRKLMAVIPSSALCVSPGSMQNVVVRFTS